jgi:hypothetical protein
VLAWLSPPTEHRRPGHAVGTVTAKKVGLETWDQSLGNSLEAMYEDIGNKFFGAGT